MSAPMLLFYARSIKEFGSDNRSRESDHIRADETLGFSSNISYRVVYCSECFLFGAVIARQSRANSIGVANRTSWNDVRYNFGVDIACADRYQF